MSDIGNGLIQIQNSNCLKDKWTEKFLKKIGLNERQIKAVIYVKEKLRIKNIKWFVKLLIEQQLGIWQKWFLWKCPKIGTTGKKTKYILRRHKDAKGATKTPQKKRAHKRPKGLEGLRGIHELTNWPSWPLNGWELAEWEQEASIKSKRNNIYEQ